MQRYLYNPCVAYAIYGNIFMLLLIRGHVLRDVFQTHLQLEDTLPKQVTKRG